jgi:hypothetical protein
VLPATSGHEEEVNRRNRRVGELTKDLGILREAAGLRPNDVDCG